MHTQWCTDVTVTNSDLQTRKKQKPLAKILIDKTCKKKKIVTKLLIYERQNLHNIQWD